MKTTIMIICLLLTGLMGYTANEDSIQDTRDGKWYKIVQIGTQRWMAENINVGEIVSTSVYQTNNDVIEKYCYNNIASNCDVYGGLYQWDEAMQYQDESSGPIQRGICMEGWHVPSFSEWSTLIEFCMGTDGAGRYLKESGTAHWIAVYPQWAPTNITGFSLRGNGSVVPQVRSMALKISGYLWTSSLVRGDYFNPQWVDPTILPVQVTATYSYPWISTATMRKFVGDGVRCIQDEPVTDSPKNTTVWQRRNPARLIKQ